MKLKIMKKNKMMIVTIMKMKIKNVNKVTVMTVMIIVITMSIMGAPVVTTTR